MPKSFPMELNTFEKNFVMPSKKDNFPSEPVAKPVIPTGVAVGLAVGLMLAIGAMVALGTGVLVCPTVGVDVGTGVVPSPHGMGLVAIGVAEGAGAMVGTAVGSGAGVEEGVADGTGVAVAEGVEVAVVEPVGSVTALASSVTPDCASALPLSLAPVFNTIAVWESMIPLKSEVVPKVACPATCQKMFWGCAPPARVMMAPLPTSRFCAIWNIQTSFGPPDRVVPVVIETPVPHL